MIVPHVLWEPPTTPFPTHSRVHSVYTNITPLLVASVVQVVLLSRQSTQTRVPVTLARRSRADSVGPPVLAVMLESSSTQIDVLICRVYRVKLRVATNVYSVKQESIRD